jgi:prepilin-type N-terminal cleavage/methylation domain-containing protein
MNRRGFTLIELLVALTLAAVAMTMAHRLFAAAADGTRALQEAHRRNARNANVVRWLEVAWRNLEVGTAQAGGFEGKADQATFTTWLLAADGWAEPHRITLDVRRGVLQARWEGDTMPLARDVLAVEFDYLLEPGADARWVRGWESPVSAPVAVRMRVHRAVLDAGRPAHTDTLLFLVKARG